MVSHSFTTQLKSGNIGYSIDMIARRHTLENRDVCAVTAAKGVCSGSGASILRVARLLY